MGTTLKKIHLTAVYLSIIASLLCSRGDAGSNSQDHPTAEPMRIQGAVAWDNEHGENQKYEFIDAEQLKQQELKQKINLNLIGSLEFPGKVGFSGHDFQVANERVYTNLRQRKMDPKTGQPTSAFKWLQVIDFSNPTDPVESGALSMGYMSFCVCDDRLLVRKGPPWAVWLYDVKNSGDPVLLGTCSLPTPAIEILLTKQHAYAFGNNQYYVIDISNETSPTLVANVPQRLSSTDMELYDSMIYLAFPTGRVSQGSTRILDITNPIKPKLLPQKASSAENLFVDYPLMFHGPYRSGIICITDISQPSAPTLLSSFSVKADYGCKVASLRSRVYVTLAGSNLDAWDISHANQPKHVGALPIRGLDSVGVDPERNLVLVGSSAGENYRLSVYRDTSDAANTMPILKYEK